MTTATDNIVPLTGNPLIDGLTWGAAWQFNGDAQTLTYSLSLNDLPNRAAWTTALSNAARQALTEWSNVANLSFVESVNDSGTLYSASSADIAFILTPNDMPSGLVGLGIPPSPSYADSLLAAGSGTRADYPQPEGDVALDSNYTGFNYLYSGGVGLTIMLHELGHALGLKHTENGPDGRPTFTSLGIHDLDSNRYTVMSYTDAVGGQLGSHLDSGNAATPMPLDILAIQQIYGANTSYHTGDDVYMVFSSSGPRVNAIWDAGGNDTLMLNYGGYAGGTVDLREGHYSVASTSQTAIAYGVTIENATGSYGTDTLIGNDAANILDGGGGYDSLIGGSGDDTYVVDAIGDTVVEKPDEGFDTVRSWVGYSLPDNVESLVSLGSSYIHATGNSLNNVMTGNDSDGWLDGGAGNDTMTGGRGSDTYDVNSPLDVVVEAPGEGQDSIRSSVSFTLPDAVEEIVLLGNGIINATGNPLDNILQGNAAANVLDGGIGIDTMRGGGGDDTYIVDNSADRIEESNGAGFDSVVSSITYALPSDVEAITLSGSSAIDAQGNGFDNVLIGNSASNLLDGRGGSDTMTGGNGNDIYVVDAVTDVVLEDRDGGVDTVRSSTSLVLPLNVENMILTGVHALTSTGNDLNNEISGRTSRDQLLGGLVKAGDRDRLDGGLGNDTLDGGAASILVGGKGDDTYVVSEGLQIPGRLLGSSLTDGLNSVLIDDRASPWHISLSDKTLDGLVDTFSIWFSGTNPETGSSAYFSLLFGTSRSGENLTPGIYPQAGLMSGTAAEFQFIPLDGTALPTVATFHLNEIEIDYSQSSPILLRLSADFDQTSYTSPLTRHVSIRYGYAGTLTSSVLELPGEGSDTVLSAITYQLPDDVENLTLTGTANLVGGGNDLANLIVGNGGNNTLTGLAGNDTIDGGTGFDTAQYSGNKADYIVMKSAGYGYTAADANSADGNEGTDTLFAVENLQFADGAVGLASRILEHAGAPSIWTVIDSQHDFNSDAKGDLWWKQANGSAAIWVMDGSNPQAPHIVGPNSGWSVVDAATDRNGDGKADLAWHNTDGSNMLWLNAVDMAAAQGIGPDAGWPIT